MSKKPKDKGVVFSQRDIAFIERAAITIFSCNEKCSVEAAWGEAYDLWLAGRTFWHAELKAGNQMRTLNTIFVGMPHDYE